MFRSPLSIALLRYITSFVFSFFEVPSCAACGSLYLTVSYYLPSLYVFARVSKLVCAEGM